jgi:threonine dehydrogenase-like Zn-dependent dehydrogenase
VFVLHPHQREISAPLEALHTVPADVPARRAVLAANMETALNVIWDSGASAGDRVLVIGAGVLGLLIAALAARLPGVALTVLDRDPARAEIATRLGARFATPDQTLTDQDVVIHASGAPEGLVAALAAAGHEATVVEASWYGSASVALPLGEAFHARRLRLISSQVGQLPPARRPRWSHARRLATALDLLRDPVFDLFITGEIAFDDAAVKVPAALKAGGSGLMTVLRY